MQQSDQSRFGFTAIIGLPNAGKSTLTNALVGNKISIVTRKVQTTRSRVVGILTHEQTQFVFVDTPGIFAAKKTLEKAMVKTALGALSSVGAVMHVVDVSQKNALAANRQILEQLNPQTPCFLVLNKIDKVSKDQLLALSKGFNDAFPYHETMMISALKNKGVGDILDRLQPVMPYGPWMYDEEQMTDMPMRFMAAEITREKIFEMLHEELPYETFVVTEGWENFDNGDVKIAQVIHVERDSQKGIVVGKRGEKIKAIGAAARKDMQELMGRKVHLNLFVKVQKDWASKAENLNWIGIDTENI